MQGSVNQSNGILVGRHLVFTVFLIPRKHNLKKYKACNDNTLFHLYNEKIYSLQ